jgi:hypothetical protein
MVFKIQEILELFYALPIVLVGMQFAYLMIALILIMISKEDTTIGWVCIFIFMVFKGKVTVLFFGGEGFPFKKESFLGNLLRTESKKNPPFRENKGLVPVDGR